MAGGPDPSSHDGWPMPLTDLARALGPSAGLAGAAGAVMHALHVPFSAASYTPMVLGLAAASRARVRRIGRAPVAALARAYTGSLEPVFLHGIDFVFIRARVHDTQPRWSVSCLPSATDLGLITAVSDSAGTATAFRVVR